MSLRRIGLILLFQFSTLLLISQQNSPNIIVLLTDDQGRGDIGYNNPAVYTPNMDALAASGVVFTRHYVMPQCTPSKLRMKIFSRQVRPPWPAC